MDDAIEERRRDGKSNPNPFGLVTEAEAYRIYGHLLGDKELRRARAAGLIGYLRRKRTIHYRRDELDDFVRKLVEEGFIRPCPPDFPSHERTARPTTTPSTEDTCRRVLAKLSRGGSR